MQDLGICILYGIGFSVNPEDGLTNEFVNLFMMIHNVCRNGGCIALVNKEWDFHLILEMG